MTSYNSCITTLDYFLPYFIICFVLFVTTDWSVSRHMAPCKKRYRLEAREFLLKDWVLLKIECTNRTCLRCLLLFKMADNRFAIVTCDDFEALLEGIDSSSINKKCSKAAGEKDFKYTTIQKPQFLYKSIPIHVQQKYGTIILIIHIAWIHEYVIKRTTVMTE